MDFTYSAAEEVFLIAARSNPGPWVKHSRHVAEACHILALHCPHLDAKKAFLYGLLHDIGRYAGVTSERHLIDGYRLCMKRGWEKAAQICITHAFMIPDIATSIGIWDMSPEDKYLIEHFLQDAVYDDYDRLIQLCDALALPEGFCILEKRFVDVALRYGVHPATVSRWKAILEIKSHFEAIMDCSIYDLLPNVWGNSMR